MENGGGSSIIDLRARHGERQSVFRSYTFPYMDRPNLTVLPQALVTRLTIKRKRTTGVEVVYAGKTFRIGAALEVVLSCGAIQTPKLLMQSGIGDQEELRAFGIASVEHLPGVGRNLQDHVGLDCVWESPDLIPPNPILQAVCFSMTDAAQLAPNLKVIAAEIVKAAPENIARFGLPSSGWTLFGGLERPASRGRVRLTGPNPEDPVRIEAHFLSEAADREAAIACVELCRAIGNSAPMKPFVKREVMPGNLKGKELEIYVRDAAVTYWHQTCTAKMGRDEMSVVDGDLKVYGIERLRIADGSILPHVTVGNTMAPCVIIGERAAHFLRMEHKV